jgi:hypothetical protein
VRYLQDDRRVAEVLIPKPKPPFSYPSQLAPSSSVYSS